MNAEQFCAEHGRELTSGKIVFRKQIVMKFITIYTNLQFSDFTASMLDRLRACMVDYYTTGYSKHSLELQQDRPAEKIELPAFIFS